MPIVIVKVQIEVKPLSAQKNKTNMKILKKLTEQKLENILRILNQGVKSKSEIS